MQTAKGRITACWFWGQTRVNRENPVAALFPVILVSDTCSDAVSHTGHLTAYMEQWPSLRQDQGITLNPLDRCHMHARAYKHSEKLNWWREWVVDRRGICDSHTRHAQCTTFIVTPALVCRSHIWCNVMQNFQRYTWEAHLTASVHWCVYSLFVYKVY